MSGAGRIDLQMFYPECLNITNIIETEREIVIFLKSKKHSHFCPECGEEMTVYHGTYERMVQDLPIFQKSVKLRIKAYEYNCVNKGCDISTFTEDYGGFVGKSERMTSRLEDFIQTLALETNCEGAAAICKELGIQVSGDTIIRLLRKMSDSPKSQCGDTIGVDDFAYRKGQTYCTVICDGTSHEAIEILDGRDGTALRAWLRQNKHIKKVTRDRAGAYAKAISEELPNVIQVADRFHLHQNLLSAIKEALKRELPNQIAISDAHISDSAPCEPDTCKKNGAKRSFRG